MQLTLRIQFYCGNESDNKNVQAFVEFPIIIGRSQSCDYVLSDESKYISSNHAVITLDSGRLFIKDTSANGVYLNGDNIAIGRGRSAPLSDSDTIAVGDFSLSVGINANAESDDPFSDFCTGSGSALPRTDSAYDPFRGDEPDWSPPSSVDPEEDILTIANASDSDNTNEAENKENINSSDPFSDWPDWDRKPNTINTPPTPARRKRIDTPPARVRKSAQRPARQQPGAQSSNVPIEAFYRAAGLDPNAFRAAKDEDVLATSGKLLNMAVTGLMALLHSRTALKHSLRSDLTSLTRTHNNPLKFSNNAEEALAKLLAGDAKNGYLPPDVAMNQAIDDLELHQLAMLDGMRAAASSILDGFDPDTMSAHLERKHPFTATIPVKREAGLWRLFQAHYLQMRSDAMDNFDAMFSREFKKAYESRINGK